MDLVSGAVGSVIRKLGELLQAEYKRHKGLPEQIEYLKKELESAHTALQKVGKMLPEELDPQVKLWAGEVREASYDMEDILDTFLIEVAATADEKKDGLLKGLQKKMAKLLNKSKARHTIAGAIEDMKKRLDEVAGRRDRFSVATALRGKPAKPDPRLADMNKQASQLIGTKKAKEELIAMLQPLSNGIGDADVSGSSNMMKIVSVVGIGGLGKTTLAKEVYEELKPQYDCGAFVPIGREPDRVQVFKNIFFDLDKQEYQDIREVKDEYLLICELKKFLRNKRYFIVIDDVWDTPNWKEIKSALVDNDNGSRVVMTTRNREVVSSEEVYKLRPLSPDNSEKLFKTRLFGIEGKCPANHPYDEASEKILDKCGGVPLAIITMASLLVDKSIEYWFDVCNSPGFYRGKGNQQLDDTEWILSLSYYDLPSNLKTCLLYLSVYPEDDEIEKDSLIWKWIAEGFVETNNRGTGLFQQGEEYFNQLINRSMIQAVESETMGTIYACRVHDMVLDLIRGLSYEENFATISNDGRCTSPSTNKVRRLAHHKTKMKQTEQDDHMKMAHVRSLVSFSCDIDSWVLHPSFKVLRVLDLVGCGNYGEDCHGLKHLGNLLHLRYLGLRQTLANYELPKEIGKLKFLQSLVLDDSVQGVLPLGVYQLTQLVCLRGGEHTFAPDGLLTKATSLEELRISIDKLNDESKRQFMKDLGNLSEVRVLTIIGSLKGIVQSDLVESLGNLHKLQHLRLMDYDGNGEAPTREWDSVVLPQHLRYLDLDDAIRFRRVPSWISPAHLLYLCRLDLCVDNMDEAGLRALGGLPELRSLSLSRPRPSMASPTENVANIIAGDGFFQKLRSCMLWDWMVQLVVNEDSTSVSFSIWNGKQGAMALFGSKTKKKYSITSSVAPAVMPNLQELYFKVPVRALYMDGNGSCGNLELECLPSLRKVKVYVDCDGASADDVEKAKAELRHVELRPNRPKFDITLVNESKMMAQSTDIDDDEELKDGGNLSATQEAEGDEAAVTESSDGDPTTPSC